MYDDMIYLTHSKTKATLSLSDFYKSPKTSKAEGSIYMFFVLYSRNVLNLLIKKTLFTLQYIVSHMLTLICVLLRLMKQMNKISHLT